MKIPISKRIILVTEQLYFTERVKKKSSSIPIWMIHHQSILSSPLENTLGGGDIRGACRLNGLANCYGQGLES